MPAHLYKHPSHHDFAETLGPMGRGAAQLHPRVRFLDAREPGFGSFLRLWLAVGRTSVSPRAGR